MYNHADRSTKGYVLRQVSLFLWRALLPYLVILLINFLISYFHFL